jgi:hypothetical protein
MRWELRLVERDTSGNDCRVGKGEASNLGGKGSRVLEALKVHRGPPRRRVADHTKDYKYAKKELPHFLLPRGYSNKKAEYLMYQEERTAEACRVVSDVAGEP